MRPTFDDGPGGFGGDLGGGTSNSFFVGVVVDDQVITLLEPQLTRGDPGVPALDAATARRRDGAAPFTVESDGSDERYRVQVRSEARPARVFVYAAPLGDVDDTLRRLRNTQILTFVAVVGALGAVTFWMVRLGVRPLSRMASTARAIGDGDLTQRIPDAVPGTETGELGIALNHMLSRIEEEFTARTASEARLRQFVADALHELRTPITTIRGYAELHRMGGLQDPANLDDAMRRTEDEARRMGLLVEDLLQLARLDQGPPLDQTPVDLSRILHDTAADARAVEPDREVRVEAPDSLVTTGDDARLRQVLSNLVGNVRVHTPPGTPVVLRACGDGVWAVVEVADQGPGMTPEVAARAFERFYRADAARDRATGGAGIGLSIVAAVAEAHRGHATIESSPGRGTTVRISIPLVAPGGAQAHPDEEPQV
jgi:two-component system OmpR family sensor kinase